MAPACASAARAWSAGAAAAAACLLLVSPITQAEGLIPQWVVINGSAAADGLYRLQPAASEDGLQATWTRVSVDGNDNSNLNRRCLFFHDPSWQVDWDCQATGNPWLRAVQGTFATPLLVPQWANIQEQNFSARIIVRDAKVGDLPFLERVLPDLGDGRVGDIPYLEQIVLPGLQQQVQGVSERVNLVQGDIALNDHRTQREVADVQGQLAQTLRVVRGDIAQQDNRTQREIAEVQGQLAQDRAHAAKQEAHLRQRTDALGDKLDAKEREVAELRGQLAQLATQGRWQWAALAAFPLLAALLMCLRGVDAAGRVAGLRLARPLLGWQARRDDGYQALAEDSLEAAGHEHVRGPATDGPGSSGSRSESDFLVVSGRPNAAM